MNKTLNDALNDAKYPEFTNRLFDCLVIPFGGKQKQKQNKSYTGFFNASPKEICYECLEEDIYDTLLDLAKYKIPKTLTKEKPILTKSQTQKNAKKRVKIINQIRSIF
jgi:hypothetical protein